MREPAGSPKVSLQLAFEKSTLQLALNPAVGKTDQNRTNSDSKAGNQDDDKHINTKGFQSTSNGIQSSVQLISTESNSLSLRAFLLLKKFMVAESRIERKSSAVEADMLPLHHSAE